MTVPRRRRRYSGRREVVRAIVKIERATERFATRQTDTRRAAHRVFEAAEDVEGSPAEAILRKAGLAPPYPPALRYAGKGSLPVIAALTPLRRPHSVAAIVRVGFGELAGYFTHEWRDDALGGGVVLGEIGSELIVAERVDTALLASRATGLPAVAAIEPERLARLEMPPIVQNIFVASDLKLPKESADAAFTLARRMGAFGVNVSLLPPPIGARTWRAPGSKSRHSGRAGPRGARP